MRQRAGRRRFARFAALLAAVTLIVPPQPGSADALATIRAAGNDLRNATAALETASRGRDRVNALTAAIAAQESGLSALRSALRQAALRQGVLERGFEAREARLARLLGALATIERDRGLLLTLHPDGPLGTVRAAMLMADITPALADEAAGLRAELAELTELRRLQQTVAADLETALSVLQDSRADLARAIDAREPLPRREVEDPETLAALATGAGTIEALADGLVPLPDAEIENESFAAARGDLPLPVAGRLLRAMGEADAAGILRPGILLATVPGALVRAPVAATVRFAGPLGRYGNVMVLEPARDYVLVLAGLGAVYAVAGDVVTAGAALATMPETGSDARDEARAAQMVSAAQAGIAAGTEAILYVELRERGVPLDPARWFAGTGR